MIARTGWKAGAVVAWVLGGAGCEPPADGAESASMIDTEGESDSAGQAEGVPSDAPCVDRYAGPEMTYLEDDPRIEDPEYAWAMQALLDHSECVDCHRTPDSAKPPAEIIWDITCLPTWTDSADDVALRGIVRRVLDPTEDRTGLDDAGRRRVADLVEAELQRRVDRRGE